MYSTMHNAPYIHPRLDSILEFCQTFPDYFGALCSNSFLRTRQLLMHVKTCVIPIFSKPLLHFIHDNIQDEQLEYFPGV